MKKYSTVIASQLLKISDFSIIGNEIVYKNEGYLWIYNVPKNTIAKLMQVDYDVYIDSKESTSSKLALIYQRLFIKDPNGVIVPISSLSMGSMTDTLIDTSTKYFYFNENWSIGIKVIRARIPSGFTINPSQTDLHVNLFFMIEYDSYSEEISERLDSLSSRVSLLESKINS